MNTKLVENLQYVTLMLLIIGQCTVGSNFYIGQCVYLVANVISVYRCFALDRPVADKVKDFSCLGVTIGIMGFRLFF